MNPTAKVLVVGAGNVGASIAYSLLNQSVATKLEMIDIDEKLLDAQILDLRHAASFTNYVKISKGDYSNLNDGDIIVITAGAAQKKGQTRLDLLETNKRILESILSEIKKSQKQVFIILVTNPVDVLTYKAIQYMDYLKPGYVFGSGTHLDSGRLRTVIGEEFKSNPRNIHAYIVGEHGDSSVPVLSNATVGGVRLKNIIALNAEKRNELMERVRRAAYKIIEGKGATYLGIGAAIADICRAILRDENRIFPLSVRLESYHGINDVVMSVPARLDEEGYHIDREIHLDEDEEILFQDSAKILKEYISQL